MRAEHRPAAFPCHRAPISSPMRRVVLRPAPVNTSTVVSVGLNDAAFDELRERGASDARRSARRRGRSARVRMSALSISTSETATVAPPERRTAARTSRARTGLAIDAPSAIVGRTSTGVRSSEPAVKLAWSGAQFSGCAANSRGRRAISPRRRSSPKPISQPMTLLPAPVGMMTLSGALNWRSSQSS